MDYVIFELGGAVLAINFVVFIYRASTLPTPLSDVAVTAHAVVSFIILVVCQATCYRSATRSSSFKLLTVAASVYVALTSVGGLDDESFRRVALSSAASWYLVSLISAKSWFRMAAAHIVVVPVVAAFIRQADMPAIAPIPAKKGWWVSF